MCTGLENLATYTLPAGSNVIPTARGAFHCPRKAGAWAEAEPVKTKPRIASVMKCFCMACAPSDLHRGADEPPLRVECNAGTGTRAGGPA